MNGTLHTFIVLRLGKMKVSQVQLAKEIGCTVQTVNFLIMGRRKSADLQKKIALYLGFPSWEMLEDSANIIAPMLDMIYNRPTYGEEAVL